MQTAPGEACELMDMLNKLLGENAEFGEALSYAVHNEALFVAWVRKSQASTSNALFRLAA